MPPSHVTTESEQSYYESKLINTLLSDYNKMARPVANHSQAVTVYFGLSLQQIIDVVSL